MRQICRPRLEQFTISKKRPKKVLDTQWYTIPGTSAIQKPTAQVITLKCKGFINEDGVSSYANSVMQCVFLSPIIRKVILNGCDGAIKDLCRQYLSNTDTTLSCMKLRQELGSPFDGSISQDAFKFLLMTMLTSCELHSEMHHTVNVHTRCRRCGTQSLDSWDENVAELVLPKSCTSIKFDDLLKLSLGWMKSENVCMSCNGHEDQRKDIAKAGGVLIFRLNVWECVEGKTTPRKANVTAVPTSTFVVNSQKYKLMAAVTEVSTSARPEYQYKALVSIGGKWMHCNDLSVSAQTWPRGSKGVYLLFYHLDSALSTQKPVSSGKIPSKQVRFTQQSIVPTKSTPSVF